MKRFAVTILLLAGLLGAHAAAAASHDIKVRVGKRSCVSYLCYKYYGRYDPAMVKHLAHKNPGVKDWQSLRAGSRIVMISKEGMERLVPPSEKETVALTYIKPPVFVFRGGKGKPIPARANMTLGAKDRVRVGHGGKAEIMATGPRLIRLGQSSTLDVQSLMRDPAKKSFTARFRLFLGKIWGKVLMMRKRKGHQLYVGSPTAVVGIRGTAYDMNVLEDKSTAIRVFEGSVEVYNPMQKPRAQGPSAGPVHKVPGPHKVKGPHRVSVAEWTQIVLMQYQEIRITPKGVGKPRSFDYWRERESDWVKWNEERDRDLSQP